ncbi:GTP pyrophosphokinase [Lachnospiraceae bacterium RM5]|nr:GTP pyrophosphokinase [Lachnospiraceae bacterium RM5]
MSDIVNKDLLENTLDENEKLDNVSDAKIAIPKHMEEEHEVKEEKDFDDPDKLFSQLITSIHKYHPSTDTTMIQKAYRCAYKAHENQKRKSGEPYIIHPVSVAIILAELELDKETIVAGLLHDVVEDTIMTNEDVAREFGEEVSLLVDGVTKLTQISYEHDKVELQAENLRKMFLAMAKDIRVILIKLADRLHNMRTMQYQSPTKQIEKSRETMEIYAPIAQRLGISKIKIELDDLALKYLKPEVYYDLKAKIDEKKSHREKFIENIIEEVKERMDKAGIECEVDGRVKHLFSIYKKMVNKNKEFDQIYDIFAVRIITSNLIECYSALGIIHEMYKPIPGRVKDYIAMPKPNMYQSLHTTLIGPSGIPFEIQIRTYEMHRIAEYGIAAHWKYKEDIDGNNTSRNEEEKMSWLRQILEWQKDMSDNKEFMSLLKSDLNLFSENVFCFTPQGDVKNLPKGSTPIDFAYSIHSAVGNKMIGARANGKMVPIDYTIQNGDRIEIVTSQNSKGPSRDWLGLVKSTQAKNKINQWFRSELKEDNIMKGKDMLEKYCKSKSIVLSDLIKTEFTDNVMKKYGFKDWNSVLASIGHGGLKEGQVVNKLIEEYEKKHAREITDEEILEDVKSKEKPTISKSKGGISVKGVHDLSVRFSKCCNPVPGDEIVGFITRGRGISIHRSDCINILGLPEMDRARIIEADWEKGEVKSKDKYMARINIYANNRMGILADIAKITTEKELDVTSMNVRINKQGLATISMSFEIGSTEELNKLIDKMRNIESVVDIKRN